MYSAVREKSNFKIPTRIVDGENRAKSIDFGRKTMPKTPARTRSPTVKGSYGRYTKCHVRMALKYGKIRRRRRRCCVVRSQNTFVRDPEVEGDWFSIFICVNRGL